MNINEKCAEILVECKFCEFVTDGNIDIDTDQEVLRMDHINPFTDTLEGRRQADAIESYLIQNNFHREFNILTAKPEITDFHQWRLDSIKWCLEQLINEEENKDE